MKILIETPYNSPQKLSQSVCDLYSLPGNTFYILELNCEIYSF